MKETHLKKERERLQEFVLLGREGVMKEEKFPHTRKSLSDGKKGSCGNSQSYSTVGLRRLNTQKAAQQSSAHKSFNEPQPRPEGGGGEPG